MRTEWLESRDVPAGDLGGYPLAEAAAVAAFGPGYDAAPFLVESRAVFAVSGGAGAGPRVMVVDAAGNERASFFAAGIDSETYRGGLHLTAVGSSVLVRPADPGAGAVFSLYSLDGAPVGGPFLGLPGDPGFRGQVQVAAGDVTGDGVADLIVSADVPGEDVSRLVAMSADGTVVSSVYAVGRVTGFAPFSIGVGLGGGRLGYAVDLSDGRTAVYGSDGDLDGVYGGV